MAKISEYPKITELSSDNTFLLEATNGTRGILSHDLANALSKLLTDDDFFAIIDPHINIQYRRNIYREKNLGTSITPEQYDEIRNGTFHNMFLGDYWTINNITWSIVDFNYWYGKGDKECLTPHVVIMPDETLGSYHMNDTNTTEGGYRNSDMYSYLTNDVSAAIYAVIGKDHILNHRDFLTDAVTNGYPSNGSWYDSTIELPSETMIYGSNIFNPSGHGSFIPSRHTINVNQLAGMKNFPRLINYKRQPYWLRDVASATYFSFVNGSGLADCYGAAVAYGVRPVFGLVG